MRNSSFGFQQSFSNDFSHISQRNIDVLSSSSRGWSSCLGSWFRSRGSLRLCDFCSYLKIKIKKDLENNICFCIYHFFVIIIMLSLSINIEINIKQNSPATFLAPPCAIKASTSPFKILPSGPEPLIFKSASEILFSVAIFLAKGLISSLSPDCNWMD